MNRNNIFLLCLLAISPIAIASSVFFKDMTTYSGVVLEDPFEDTKDLDSVEQLQYPEEFYTDITHIEIENGEYKPTSPNWETDPNAALPSIQQKNDGESLKFDSDTFNDPNGYNRFNITFEFGANWPNFNTFPIDFYDLYVYVDFITSTLSGYTVEVQGLTVEGSSIDKWNTFAVTSGEPVHIDRLYLERTFKIKLTSQLGANQEWIEVDRIRIILAHGQNNPNDFQIKLNKFADPVYKIDYEANNLELLHKRETDSDWWKDLSPITGGALDGRSPIFPQNARFIQRMTIDATDEWISYSYIRSEISMFLENGTLINVLQANDLSTGYSVYFWNVQSGLWPMMAKVETELFNFNLDTFDTLQKVSTEPFPWWWTRLEPYGQYDNNVKATVQNSWNNLIPMGNLKNYIGYHPDNNRLSWKFKTSAWMNADDNMHPDQLLCLYIDYANTDIIVSGYDFEDHDYPTVSNVLTPAFSDSIINTYGSFKLKSDVTAGYLDNTVNNVQYYIQGPSWNSGWNSMNIDPLTGIGDTWEANVDPSIFQDGFDEYSVWVKGTDTLGFSTMEHYDFTYINQAPIVEVNFPINDEVIIQTEAYPFDVKIYDLENNNLNPATTSFQIYDEFDVPVYADWQPMIVTRDYFDENLQLDYYVGRGSFEPTVLGVGKYTFVARVEDEGYSNYIGEHFGRGEANFTISNEQPRIEFIDPNFEDPESRKIDLLNGYTINVSIEDPELNPYWDVQLRIYHDDPNNPDLDWTPMVENPLEQDNWTLTTDPIDFGLGYYTIEVRVTDAFGTSSNSISVLFPNKRPGITFNTPKDGDLIDDLFNYLVNVTIIDPEANPISDVSLMIYNDLDQEQFIDRLDLIKNPSTNDWGVLIDPYDLTFGDYRFEVIAADPLGYGVNSIDISYFNNRPEIFFNNPRVESEIIDDAFSYNVIVNVTDSEDDFIEEAHFKMFSNDEDNPEIDWTNMTQISGTTEWNFTFDPLDYPTGFYTFQINTSDPVGYSDAQITILFQRYDPVLEYDPINKYTILQYDNIQNIGINFTKGASSVSNFTWAISTEISNLQPSGSMLLTNTIQSNLDQSYYSIPLDPKDLPNGDFHFSIIAVNHTGDKFYYATKNLKVDYFVQNSLQDPETLNDYYAINTNINYGKSDVRANSFIRGNIIINYQVYPAFNYRFTMPKTLHNKLYRLNPDYQIQRQGDNNPYLGVLSSDVDFQFNKKPSDMTDTLSFNIDTPTLGPVEEDGKPDIGTLDDGRDYLEVEIRLRSDLDFDNIQCEYEPMIPIREAGTYAYTLYIQENGEWVKTDIDLDFKGELFEETWSFTVPSIKEGEEIRFKIYGVRTDIEEFNYAPLIYGAIFAGLFCAVWMLLGRKRILKMKVFKTRPWLFWVIGVAIAVGIVAGVYFGVIALEASIGNYTIYTK